MKRLAGSFIALFILLISVMHSTEVTAQSFGIKIVPDINKSRHQSRGSERFSWRENKNLFKARERIHYQNGSVAQGQLAQLLYKTPSYYPCGYIYTAELYPLSGDPDLYLHEKVAGTWRKLKQSINGGTAVDSFTFTCEDITDSATNVDLDVKGYTAASYEFFLYREATLPSFSLRFPVSGYNAYSAPISSVFDHSAYSSPSTARNGVVVAYSGETGSYQPYPSDTTCINQASGAAFIVNGYYRGASSCGGRYYLSYDGHNGIDYPFVSGTPIYSTADGTITASDCAARSTGISCSGRGSGYGRLTIDHGNGYKTIYLHLSAMADTVSLNGWYPQGTLVGYSGSTGTGAAHLHVSISKDGIYVDPYGWTGSGTDPYPGLNGGVQNTRLWE